MNKILKALRESVTETLIEKEGEDSKYVTKDEATKVINKFQGLHMAKGYDEAIHDLEEALKEAQKANSGTLTPDETFTIINKVHGSHKENFLKEILGGNEIPTVLKNMLSALSGAELMPPIHDTPDIPPAVQEQMDKMVEAMKKELPEGMDMEVTTAVAAINDDGVFCAKCHTKVAEAPESQEGEEQATAAFIEHCRTTHASD